MGRGGEAVKQLSIWLAISPEVYESEKVLSLVMELMEGGLQTTKENEQEPPERFLRKTKTGERRKEKITEKNPLK